MYILKQSYCQQPSYHVDTTKSLYNVDTCSLIIMCIMLLHHFDTLAVPIVHVDITMLTFHAGIPEHHCSDRRVPPSGAECWS